LAQRVVGERTRREHHHADPRIEQADKVLSHRVVRSRLEHRIGTQRDQCLPAW
jgi:hypothetical protein